MPLNNNYFIICVSGFLEKQETHNIRDIYVADYGRSLYNIALIMTKLKMRETTRANPGRKAALKLIKWQLVLTLVIALAFLFIWDFQAVWSAVLAGAVCMVANLFFIIQTLKYRSAQAAKRFLLAFWLAETAKLVIMGVLSVFAVKFLGAELKLYIISFIINLMVFWFTPFFILGY